MTWKIQLLQQNTGNWHWGTNCRTFSLLCLRRSWNSGVRNNPSWNYLVFYLNFKQILNFCEQISCWMLQASRQTDKIRKKFFKSILRQDISFFDLHSAGQLNSRLAEFVYFFGQAFFEFLTKYLQDVFLINSLFWKLIGKIWKVFISIKKSSL